MFIFPLLLFRKTEKSIITFDTFGKLLNFVFLFKILILGTIMYILLFATLGEGLYFEWVNMYFVGHIVMMVMIVMVPTLVL